METNLLLVIIALLVLFLIMILGGISFLLYKYFKVSQWGLTTSQGPEVVNSLSQRLERERIPAERLREIDVQKHKQHDVLGQFCIDHPELPAKGRCSISDEVYCELCITKENDIRIARKFLNLFLDHDWQEIYLLNNEKIGADKLNELIRLKKQIWKEEEIPIIVQKQFKINIEKDRIEAYTIVMSRENQHNIVKERLNFLNS